MKHSVFFILLVCVTFSFSQIPQGYYDSAEGKIKADLKTALAQIIQNGHSTNTYTSLWTHFQKTDKAPSGYVWDMYSDCNYVFVTDQCGNYSSECDCYNREHSFPVSWMGGGEPYPMYADLHHLVPVDGWANNKRGNFPLGNVGSVTWTSNNGTKLGTSNYPGYSGTAFEPIDEYKGDFARMQFYMVTRYENLLSSWYTYDVSATATLDGTTWPGLKQWSASLYLNWHESDPVSAKEIARNDSIYKIQNNRNPFIDKPEFARQIWGPDATISSYELCDNLFPVPVDNFLNLSFTEPIYKISFSDILGRTISDMELNGMNVVADLGSFVSGIYFIHILSQSGKTEIVKIIKH